MKKFRRTDGYSEIDLLVYAKDHRDAAICLFEASPEFFDSACYLSHLSVELLLKSVLLHLTGEFSDSHSLTCLQESLHRAGVEIEISATEREQLLLLDNAWDIRYPHPQKPKPAGHSHREALRSIWSRVEPKVPVEMRAAFENRSINLKGGRKFMVRPADDLRAQSVTEHPKPATAEHLKSGHGT